MGVSHLRTKARNGRPMKIGKAPKLNWTEKAQLLACTDCDAGASDPCRRGDGKVMEHVHPGRVALAKTVYS